MIEESYVSFEVAKLLKEKGFNEETQGYYPIKGDATGRLMFGSEYPHNNSQVQISAPTQQMAMRWLREENGIFIEISVSIDLNGDYHYSYSILDKECKYIRKGLSFEWNYEEAVEAAIKACLENLI